MGEVIVVKPTSGLTAEKVDWSLLAESDFDQRLKREQIEKWPSLSDFHSEAWEARRKARKNDDSYLRIRISPELKPVLEQHRPKTLFFEPEEIVSLLTPGSDVVVEHQKTDQFEKWVFTLNPQKYEVSEEHFGPHRKQTVSLTRGKVSEHGEYQEPYLVVCFPARYDGSNIIFYPDIKITHGDSVPRDEVEAAIIKLLGLKEHSIQGKLNFKIKKEKHEQTQTDRSGKTRKGEKWHTYPVIVSLK